MAAENLSGSRSAGTELQRKLLTAGRDHSDHHWRTGCAQYPKRRTHEASLSQIYLLAKLLTGAHLCSLEEINQFEDETLKNTVTVNDYFSDTSKFIRSVGIKLVSFNLLDEKKCSCLKKHIKNLEKATKGKTTKKSQSLHDIVPHSVFIFLLFFVWFILSVSVFWPFYVEHQNRVFEH